jgi:hypothetical protein
MLSCYLAVLLSCADSSADGACGTTAVLVSFEGKVEEYIKGFSQYRMGVPVYGCIILDPSLSHCLLVKVGKRACARICTHTHARACRTYIHHTCLET